MPATGDRITKRKDGLFQGMYTAQTPNGPKRKYIYGRKKKDVERHLAGFTRKKSSPSPPLRYKHCSRQPAETVWRPCTCSPYTRACGRASCWA
jgi:hypothetical protein